MPRPASTVRKPHTLTPVRFFQLSAAQVSLYFSPARGMEWNVQATLPVRMSHARTSPAGPSGGFSCVVPPAMTRVLNTIGGEVSPLRPGSPCMISGVFMLTTPLSPNASLGFPVFASTEYNLPSLEPKTICAGVRASPGQYSMPRVEGALEGSWKAQISFPVVGSTATTREYGVDIYIVPSMTRGVFSLGRKPDPPRPRPNCAPSGVSPTAAPAPRPSGGVLPSPRRPAGAVNPAGFM